MEQQEITKMIAFFHTEEPVSRKWEDTWTEEEDSRTLIYVEYPEGKFVIKAAANDFTTPERVAGWVEMINNFREMGYYCPMLMKSRSGNYTEVLEVDGKTLWYGRKSLRNIPCRRMWRTSRGPRMGSATCMWMR